MGMDRGLRMGVRAGLIGLAGVVALGAPPAPGAAAAMTSERLGPKLCVTTGGARIVPIPGFPGERIDRRLLRDIRFLRREYKVFITDGYSDDPVHSANGEHPLGLALDIVPDTAAGGLWRDISRLARFAEPKQNAPRPPFRWVGYDGDANHGKGHHLHLSYSHSGPRPKRPPRTVYTLKCPRPAAPEPKPEPGKGGGGGGSGGSGGSGGNSGGISARHMALAPIARETGGVPAR